MRWGLRVDREDPCSCCRCIEDERSSQAKGNRVLTSTPPESQKTVILVHGAFHGAWCWEYVAEGLARRGVAVLSVDLPGRGENSKPLGGLDEDAQEVREAIESCPGSVILCGHSYGGSVITEATDAAGKVEHLVYLAAGVPDVGESLLELFPEVHETEFAEAIRPCGPDRVDMNPESAARIFYEDCEEETATWAVSQMGEQILHTLTSPVSRAPWRTLDSTYVICTQDRVLPLVAQQRLAKRCHRSVVWDSSHSPMLSQPERVVSLLADLVA